MTEHLVSSPGLPRARGLWGGTLSKAHKCLLRQNFAWVKPAHSNGFS